MEKKQQYEKTPAQTEKQKALPKKQSSRLKDNKK